MRDLSLFDELFDNLKSVNSLCKVEIHVFLVLSAREFQIDRAHDLVDLKKVNYNLNFHCAIFHGKSVNKVYLRCIFAQLCAPRRLDQLFSDRLKPS